MEHPANGLKGEKDTVPRQKSKSLSLWRSGKRASTLAVSQEQQEDDQQTTGSLIKSPFFAKLPLELREPIYEELFGHRKVHVVWPFLRNSDRQDREEEVLGRPAKCWWHCVCDATPESPFWENTCREHALQPSKVPAKKLDTAILFTCRQAYVLLFPRDMKRGVFLKDLDNLYVEY